MNAIASCPSVKSIKVEVTKANRIVEVELVLYCSGLRSRRKRSLKRKINEIKILYQRGAAYRGNDMTRQEANMLTTRNHSFQQLTP